jgi:heat shock protein HslJ
VVPERFLGVWPGETCGARGSFSELGHTYWRLTRLGERPVVLSPGQNEPYLVFDPQNNQVAGSGGCNYFVGAYEMEGTSIRFGVVASHAMACPEGEDLDADLLAVIEGAVSFRKTAHHLELFDADGAMIARFEARELK